MGGERGALGANCLRQWMPIAAIIVTSTLTEQDAGNGRWRLGWRSNLSDDISFCSYPCNNAGGSRYLPIAPSQLRRQYLLIRTLMAYACITAR